VTSYFYAEAGAGAVQAPTRRSTFPSPDGVRRGRGLWKEIRGCTKHGHDVRLRDEDPTRVRDLHGERRTNVVVEYGYDVRVPIRLIRLTPRRQTARDYAGTTQYAFDAATGYAEWSRTDRLDEPQP